MTAQPLPALTDKDRELATLIAMHVRNELEQIHGGGNRLDRTDAGGEDGGLTDEQMAAINPIVRNAVADVLHALTNFTEYAQARFLIRFLGNSVPSYWEPAELSDDIAHSNWAPREAPLDCGHDRGPYPIVRNAFVTAQ